MRNGQTLNLAIEFMQKKRDDMARQWQVLRQEVDSAQERLNLLASYTQESQTRWAMRSRNATPQILMQQHFKVIEKLESAIGMQKEVLADKALKYTHQRQLWTEAEQRIQILQRYQSFYILLNLT